MKILLRIFAVLSLIGSMAIATIPSQQKVEAVGASKIIGFVSGYDILTFNTLNNVNFSHVTHVIYSDIRATSSSNPTLVMGGGYSTGYITNTVSVGHAAGASVLVSYYGTSDATTIISNASLRAQLISNLSSFITTYGLDGVDIDIEDAGAYGSPMNTFLNELRVAIPTKLITVETTWYPPGSINFNMSVAASSNVDFINVMCYDMNTPHALPEHSRYDDSIAVMDEWYDAGYSKSKLIMGIPFYTKDNNGSIGAYSQTYDQFGPFAESTDSVSTSTANGFGGSQTVHGGVLWFGGIDTNQSKANWLKTNGYAGVSIFTLGYDKFDANSMLTVLYDEFSPKTYYVSKAGDDGDDGSFANPWLTINHAASVVTAGDTVYVMTGTYTENISVAHSGTPGNFITFKNYGTNTVIIDGTGLTTYPGLFTIDDQDYIVVDGFTISNSTSNGIAIVHENHYITIKNTSIIAANYCGVYIAYDTNTETFNDGKETYITLDNIEVTQCQAGASEENISFINVSYFEIKNSRIHDNYHQASIDLKVGCHDGSIHDNEIYNETGVGLYIDTRGNTYNIDIYDNLFHDNEYSITLSNEVAISYLISYINIYNNIFYNNTYLDFLIYNEQPYTIDHVYFINNTIYHTTRAIHIHLAPSDITNSVIANNIFSQTSGEMIRYYGVAPSSGMTITNNLFYATVSYDSNNTYGSNYVYDQDPLFVSPTTNFSITNLSPALDTGTATNAPSLDYAGIARPKGVGYDIGAYEDPITVILAASNSSAGDKSAAIASGGAVCPGFSDHTTINTYLIGGATVELKAGTYYINGMIIPNTNDTLYGQAGGTSILSMQNNNGCIYINHSGIEVYNFSISGNEYANGGVVVTNYSITTIQTVSVHDITNTALGGDDFVVYANNGTINTVVFYNCTATSPDGFGFIVNGSGATSAVNGIYFYNCSVTNAGVASTRTSSWVTGFDICEYSGMVVNGVYLMKCSVDGAWESDYHMEMAPTKSNIVIVGSSAANSGKKTAPTYGAGYLIDGLRDVILYNNTGSTNWSSYNARWWDGTVYTNITTSPISQVFPSTSVKTTAGISVGNCAGTVINNGNGTYLIVAYSTDGNPVSQSITVAGNSVALSFDYYTVQAYEPSATTPLVVTGTASASTTTASTMGQVTNIGTSNVTAWGTYYGLSTGAMTSHVDNSGTKTGAFQWTDSLTSLTASTTYYYKSYATNGSGTVYGSIAQFTTTATGSAPSQPSPYTIVTAKAFQNIYQTGDILIIFEYNLGYTAIPAYSCSELFYCQLLNGSDALTPVRKPLNYFNYNMSSLYFSKADVTALGLVWGTTTYKVRIAETDLFSVPTTVDFGLSGSSQWMTQSDASLARGYVKAYLLSVVVNDLQARNTTTYIVNVANASVLNTAGRALVLTAIPYLDTPIPELFQMSTSQIVVTQPTATGALQTNQTLEKQLGSQVSTAFTNFGSLLHVSGQQVALGWFLLCILIIVSIVFLATGNLIGASIVSLPMVLIGAWVGAIPMAFIFTGVLVMVVLLSFYLFVRGM